MADNYPNNSDTFMDVPEEREEQERKEQVRVTSSIPVIQDVLDWFDDAAESFNSNDTLNITIETPESTVKHAVLLRKAMREVLNIKAEEFRTEFSEYLEKDE